jgi:hypothetical protein
MNAENDTVLGEIGLFAVGEYKGLASSLNLTRMKFLCQKFILMESFIFWIIEFIFVYNQVATLSD